MIGTNHQLQGFQEQQLVIETAHQFRVGHAANPDIQFARFQSREQHGVIHGGNLDRGMPLLLVELANHRRKNAQRGGGQCPDADDLAGVFFFSMQRLACGIERIQHLNGMRKELFAHDGKLRPQPTPVKKTGAGQLFELVEGFRERRLAQVKSFSRTPQRSLLSDGHKCMQMAQAYALTEQTIFFHRRC